MSPLIILQSCGNSSKLDLRKKEPTGVKNCAGFAKRWVATAGVSTCIVRNFGILNSRLKRPTRSDQYKIGPIEVNRTSSATTTIGSNNNNKATSAKHTSNNRFILILHLKSNQAPSLLIHPLPILVASN